MPRPLDPALVLRGRARRAHLDRSGVSLPGIARALVGLHGTDPASVHLTLHARLSPRPLAAVIDALRSAIDEERALYKIHGMRRTLHYVDPGIAPAVVGHARARLDGERQKQVGKLLAAAGTPDLATLRREVLAALADHALSTEELQERIPALATRIELAPGKSYGTTAPVCRLVLEALGTEGSIVRSKGIGGWKQGKSAWSRLDAWAPALRTLDKPTAYAELTRAWLAAYAPGTLDDLAWWAGIPKGDARAALVALGDDVVEVEVAGWPGPRYALAGTALEDDGPPVPVALLPALDPSGMCWTDRAPFLDPAVARPLWDNNGNLAPTVWLDGRIVGGWACRKDGAVTFRVLDPAGLAATDAIRAEAERLSEALAGEVVAPRFPTPLSKELAAG